MSWLTRRYFTASLILSSPSKQQAQDKEAQVTCDVCTFPGLSMNWTDWISRIALTFHKMHFIEGCSKLPGNVWLWPLTWILREPLSVFHNVLPGQEWVTRGHQSPACVEVTRGPRRLTMTILTMAAAPMWGWLAVGALSAISGLSPGPASLRSLRPRAALLSSMPVRLARQQLLVRCPGEDRGWSARRERECTGGWSPWSQAGPRHPGSETGDQGLIITLLHHDTLSRIITQSRSHTQGLCFLDTETPIHFAVRFDLRDQSACSG